MDRMLITSERHLRLVLSEYVEHYNVHPRHRTLCQRPPAGRERPPTMNPNARVLRRDRLGGLIREYAQVAWGDRIFGTHRSGDGRGGVLSEDFPAHLAGFRAGSRVAGYRLEAQVGTGGMAVVFRARDERLGRLVALKILAPALAADAAFRRRFIAESRAAAAVDDQHIIPVYEAGEADGVLFIAMRFVQGGDLRLVLDREGALPPGRAAAFISPVASALDAAHRAGLVHRDVKPANILVDARDDRPDHVYLSDFGVSKGAMTSVSLTGTGQFLGTPDYSAPEQIQGLVVDGRTDQYALACVAYQLLTETAPYERDQGMAVLLAHLSAPPPSLSSRRPGLAGAADQVLARGMAKVPEKRYGSCRDFADALREALGLAPYHSRGSPTALDHPQPEIASSHPGSSRPAGTGSGQAAVPADPAATATVDSAPGGQVAAADVPAAAIIVTGPASADADDGATTVSTAAAAVAEEGIPAAAAMARAASQPAGKPAAAGESSRLTGELGKPATQAGSPASAVKNLMAEQRARADSGSGADGTQSARRPRRRIAHPLTYMTVWIRHYRFLTIAIVGAVLAAAGIVPLVLASSPSSRPDSARSGPAGSTSSTDTPAQELASAKAGFFLPRRSVDPFGANAYVSYDPYNLLATTATDPVGNITTAAADYRVLRPVEVTDPNGNRAAVAFDALGLVAGTAVMGKTTENVGDSLSGFTADLDQTTIQQHLADPLTDPGPILGSATTRILYDLAAYYRTRGGLQPSPPAVYTLARETHVSDLAGSQTRYQHAFAYGDGFGREIQRKILADPGPVTDAGPAVSPRWIASGWTILNNKDKPVRKYEPFFTATNTFEFAAAVGVSSVLLYDPPGRLVATLHPDNTWGKVVFDCWRQENWDGNDTVLISDPRTDPDVGAYFTRLLGAAPNAFTSWHDLRINGTYGSNPDAALQQQNAATKTQAHAKTPTVAHFDALGRTCLTVADNAGEARYPSRVAMDTQGKPLAIFDALGRRAMEYIMRAQQASGTLYLAGRDLTGSLIYQDGMDNGARQMLGNVAGKPIRTWDSRGHAFRIRYDLLQRQTHNYVSTSGAPEILIQRSVYGEGQAGLNLCGRLFRQYDTGGLASNDQYDFKGNLASSTRQLARDYRQSPDWSPLADLTTTADLDTAAGPLLNSTDNFSTATTYDALNRPIQVVTPHSATMHPNVLRPGYNQAQQLGPPPVS